MHIFCTSHNFESAHCTIFGQPRSKQNIAQFKNKMINDNDDKSSGCEILIMLFQSPRSAVSEPEPESPGTDSGTDLRHDHHGHHDQPQNREEGGTLGRGAGPKDADPHHRDPQRPFADPPRSQDGPGLEPLGEPSGSPCPGGAPQAGRQHQLLPGQPARLPHQHAQLLPGQALPAPHTPVHWQPRHGQRLVDFRGAIQTGKKNFLTTKKNFLTTRHISLTLPVSSPLSLSLSRKM